MCVPNDSMISKKKFSRIMLNVKSRIIYQLICALWQSLFNSNDFVFFKIVFLKKRFLKNCCSQKNDVKNVALKRRFSPFSKRFIISHFVLLLNKNFRYKNPFHRQNVDGESTNPCSFLQSMYHFQHSSFYQFP